MRFKAVLLAQITFIASYFTMTATFLAAYISPIDMVIVDINKYGEARLELVFLLLTIPCVAYYISRLRWREGRLWVAVDE